METSNIISLIGILITGVFSLLVWRATVNSNKLAKASYDLSDTIVKTETNREDKIKRAYHVWMFDRIEKVIGALNSSDLRIALRGPRDIGLKTDIFARYFSIDEQNIIIKIFKMLDEFEYEVKNEMSFDSDQERIYLKKQIKEILESLKSDDV